MTTRKLSLAPAGALSRLTARPAQLREALSHSVPRLRGLLRPVACGLVARALGLPLSTGGLVVESLWSLGIHTMARRSSRRRRFALKNPAHHKETNMKINERLSCAAITMALSFALACDGVAAATRPAAPPRAEAVNPPPPPPPPPTSTSVVAVAVSDLAVKAIAPTTRLTPELLRASGQVRAKHRATLSAPMTGRLVRVSVKEGDRVTRGQVLAELNTASLAIGLDQARAGLVLASASVDGAAAAARRSRQLAAAASIPAAELDRAEVALRQAEAQQAQAVAAVRSAEQSLRDARLLAPFSGTITARLKDVGDTVAMMPPTPIFELVNTDDVEIRALVPEAIIDRIPRGGVVRGTISPSGVPFEAKVTNVGSMIDTQNRTVELLADLKGDRRGATVLRPGTLVELELASNQSAVTGLFLPSQAVALRAAGHTEAVVVKDGRARWVLVKVERVRPGTVRVLSGLTAEDRVVADLAVPIADGATVSLLP